MPRKLAVARLRWHINALTSPEFISRFARSLARRALIALLTIYWGGAVLLLWVLGIGCSCRAHVLKMRSPRRHVTRTVCFSGRTQPYLPYRVFQWQNAAISPVPCVSVAERSHISRTVCFSGRTLSYLPYRVFQWQNAVMSPVPCVSVAERGHVARTVCFSGRTPSYPPYRVFQW